MGFSHGCSPAPLMAPKHCKTSMLGAVIVSERGFLEPLVGRFARIDSRFEKKKKTFFFFFRFRIDLPKNGIAARIGHESWREDAIRVNLAKCFKNRYFLQIDSRESAKRWCANRLPTKFEPH